MKWEIYPTVMEIDDRIERGVLSRYPSRFEEQGMCENIEWRFHREVSCPDFIARYFKVQFVASELNDPI